MLVTLVAMLCQIGTPICVEKVIATDTSKMDCMVEGQAGIVQWMAQNEQYKTGWTVASWRCLPGDYIPKNDI